MTPNPKTANDADVTAALQRLDRALGSPRVVAAKAVAEYRGERPATKINQHDDRGGRRLDVDACIQCSQPNYAPNVGEQRRRGLMRKLLFWRQSA